MNSHCKKCSTMTDECDYCGCHMNAREKKQVAELVTSQQEEWEERFDEEFPVDYAPFSNVRRVPIKSFIHSLLASKASAIREMKKPEKEHSYRPDAMEINASNTALESAASLVEK